MRRRPELMQLLSVRSTRRNLPPKGTAPLDRSLVKGCNRSPAPPAIIITKIRSMVLVVCRPHDVKRMAEDPPRTIAPRGKLGRCGDQAIGLNGIEVMNISFAGSRALGFGSR